MVRASQCSASSSPPPSAAPLIAATVGNGERANPAEQLVARAGPRQGGFGGRHLRELVDVGADAEHERLARHDHRRPVARLELVDQRHRRLERGTSERRRLAVVLAVVDGDERDRPDGRVDAIQMEDGVRHYWTFSQRMAQPIPIPMQSAVRP